MFNIFNLFAIIAPPAVTVDLDDTQPIQPIVDDFEIVPLDAYFPFTMSDLLKKRVVYRHFDTERTVFTGRVVGFSATQIQVMPDAINGMSLLTKWRSIDDVAGIVEVL